MRSSMISKIIKDEVCSSYLLSIMFPDILLLENTFIQFYFSLCAFTQSFFENNVKCLPCLKSDKSNFYSQTIFSFGGNLSKLPTVLVPWALQRAIILRSKTRYYCTPITSAAKIARHLADTVNYPLRFNESRTRIKFCFEYFASLSWP